MIQPVDWMGCPIKIGQRVAYCGADASGFPEATVTEIRDSVVMVRLNATGFERAAKPKQLIVLTDEGGKRD